MDRLLQMYVRLCETVLITGLQPSKNRPSYFANAKRNECRERYCNDSVFCQDDYELSWEDGSSMCNPESLRDDVEMFEPNNGDESYVSDVDECMSDESGVRDTDIFFPVIVNETSTVVGLRDTMDTMWPC